MSCSSHLFQTPFLFPNTHTKNTNISNTTDTQTSPTPPHQPHKTKHNELMQQNPKFATIELENMYTKGYKMAYAPYTQTIPTKLHNYLDEEEIRVMANLADIAFETIISQDPDLENVYDIVLNIANPDYKVIAQNYVTRHREFVNREIDLDEDATDTENYLSLIHI